MGLKMEEQKIKTITTSTLFKPFGLIPRSISEWFKMSWALIGLSNSLIFFSVYLIYYRENGEQIDIMDAVHWDWLILSTFVSVYFMLTKKNVIAELDELIYSGLIEYDDSFADKQKKMRNETNRNLLKLTKYLFWAFLIGGSSALTKKPIFLRKQGEWNQFFVGYVPFEVNSWFSYTVAMIWLFLLTVNIATLAFMVCYNFVASGFQLIGEIRILEEAILHVFSEKRTQNEIHQKLKLCAAHHREIKRMHSLVQDYTGFVNGIIPALSVGLFCTFVYNITDPNNKIGLSVAVILVESLFIFTTSFLGQQITDSYDKIGNCLYFVDWYTQSLPVQKHILMMMIACKKPMVIQAFGIFSFSFKGLKEVIQTSFTYFNALNATR